LKALQLEHGSVALREARTPEPAQGEALVRVSLAGICSTDLEIAKGYMGFSGVLGHELCGVVEACADSGWVGRRVAGEINLACGQCRLCKRGLGRHCPARTVLGILGKDGCFAQYVTLPVANLHALPDALDDVRACFVEPTAAAFEVIEQVAIGANDRVAVLGDGKLGLLSAQVLQTTGCELTLVGRHARKLQLAAARGIASAAAADLPAKSFDVVVEATGSADGMHAAIGLLRPRGTLVLKSTYHGMLTLDAAPIVIDELTIVGSRCGPFERAIPALASGAVDPSPLVDAIIPLADGIAALEHAAQPGVLKVLLDMRTE
jgi:threonine dehydrogenase-like Zn-dependent dehydrogenase